MNAGEASVKVELLADPKRWARVRLRWNEKHHFTFSAGKDCAFSVHAPPGAEPPTAVACDAGLISGMGLGYRKCECRSPHDLRADAVSVEGCLTSWDVTGVAVAAALAVMALLGREPSPREGPEGWRLVEASTVP